MSLNLTEIGFLLPLFKIKYSSYQYPIACAVIWKFNVGSVSCIHLFPSELEFFRNQYFIG